MYDELVKRLRDRAKRENDYYEHGGDTINEAADAIEEQRNRIEELELHYCPHAIRNVHDRGDDSLCRVLGAEPPKEETK